MGGIPPFAGFLGKYYLFLAAIQVELYFTVFFALISAASIFVYLKIIKVILFESSKDDVILSYNENNYLGSFIIGFFVLYIVGLVILNVLFQFCTIFGINYSSYGISFIFDLTSMLTQVYFIL